MRALTPQEINAAPDWATHYVIDSDDDLTYESLDWWCWATNPYHKHDNHGCIDGVPIPRKEFDISKHEFGYAFCSDYASITFEMYEGQSDLILEKQDAIAIAKHFKLTAEDLK